MRSLSYMWQGQIRINMCMKETNFCTSILFQDVCHRTPASHTGSSRSSPSFLHAHGLLRRPRVLHADPAGQRQLPQGRLRVGPRLRVLQQVERRARAAAGQQGPVAHGRPAHAQRLQLGVGRRPQQVHRQVLQPGLVPGQEEEEGGGRGATILDYVSDLISSLAFTCIFVRNNLRYRALTDYCPIFQPIYRLGGFASSILRCSESGNCPTRGQHSLRCIHPHHVHRQPRGKS